MANSVKNEDGKKSKRGSKRQRDLVPTTGLAKYLTEQDVDAWQCVLVDTGQRAQNNCWDHFKKYKADEKQEWVVCLICLRKELEVSRAENRDLIPKNYEVKYGAGKSTSKLTSHDERKHQVDANGVEVVKRKKSSKDVRSKVDSSTSQPISTKPVKQFTLKTTDGNSMMTEPFRLLLTLTKLDWTEVKIPREEWDVEDTESTQKALPYLVVPNGDVFKNVIGLVRFTGKHIQIEGHKLYPDHAIKSLAVDEWIARIEGLINDLTADSFVVSGDQASEMVRSCTLGGSIFDKLTMWDNACKGPYLTGDRCTIADVLAFWVLTYMQTGYLVGVPQTIINPFANLTTMCNRVKNHRIIREFFLSKTDPFFEYFVDRNYVPPPTGVSNLISSSKSTKNSGAWDKNGSEHESQVQRQQQEVMAMTSDGQENMIGNSYVPKI